MKALRSVRAGLAGLAALAGLAGVATGQGMLQKALNDDVAPHWIYDDWSAAVSQARASGKPIMAVVRCVP